MSARQTYSAQAWATLALGLPIIGSNLAQMALHVTDTVLLGRYGTAPLAAVVIGTSTFFVLYVLGAGFGIAVMGMVASALGRGDEVLVRRETRMGMWLSIVYGLLTVPLFWFSRPLLIHFGQEPDVAQLAQDFLRIAGWGMIPALLVTVLKSYLSALEKTQVMLWVTLSAVFVNLALAWVLIFGYYGFPELGVRGAAIASLTVQALTFLLLALYAAKAEASRRFRLFQRFWRPDWQSLRSVLRIGLPAGFTGLAESGLFVAAAVMMGWIGTVELAAHGIAMEVTALSFMVHMGLSNAATVRVGRAEGEGDLQGMRDAGVTAVGLSAGFGVLMIVLFLIERFWLVSLFIDVGNPDSERIIAVGGTLMLMAALFQMFDAMQVMALGLLRGVRDTRVPMWIAIVSYWFVGVPVSYGVAFLLGFGAPGLWLGLAVGLAVAAAFLMLRFWRGSWLVAQAAA